MKSANCRFKPTNLARFQVSSDSSVSVWKLYPEASRRVLDRVPTHQRDRTSRPRFMSWQRPDGRSPDRVRPVKFIPNFTTFADASVLAQCGETKVLCTASVQLGVPKFLADTGSGWLTAEYRMLPGATPERQQREVLKLSGRTQEIQRLIGRSLRAALDLEAIGERTIVVDADVLQADAGTRTTAITGGYVALALATDKLQRGGAIARSPLRYPVAAVSVGIIDGDPFLDLNYREDAAADVDFNVVMNGDRGLIEVQGTAEAGSFSRAQLDRILDFAQKGIGQLFVEQETVLSAVRASVRSNTSGSRTLAVE